MTRKHFEAAAEVCQAQTDEERPTVIEAFCELFARFNDNFDSTRFILACVPGNNVKARG